MYDVSFLTTFDGFKKAFTKIKKNEFQPENYLEESFYQLTLLTMDALESKDNKKNYSFIKELMMMPLNEEEFNMMFQALIDLEIINDISMNDLISFISGENSSCQIFKNDVKFTEILNEVLGKKLAKLLPMVIKILKVNQNLTVETLEDFILNMLNNKRPKLNIRFVSSSFLLNEDENKFILFRRNYGSLKGYYEFPGGKIENHESIEETLKREFNEEIEFNDFENLGIYGYDFFKNDDTIFIIIFQFCKVNEKDILEKTKLNVYDKIAIVEEPKIKSFISKNKVLPADVRVIKNFSKLYF